MSERERYRGHLDINRVEERRQMRRERKIAKSGLVVRWLLERLGKIIFKHISKRLRVMASKNKKNRQ